MEHSYKFQLPALWGDVYAMLLLVGGLILAPLGAQAQSFDFGGFVKAEYLYDSRQVVSAREGEFVFYPAPDSDATDVSNLGAFVFFSRLEVGIGDLPDVLGGEVSGFLDADFFGAAGENVSTLRLRRAFAKITWEDRELLFGQSWSPLFTAAAFPRTIATTAGVPFQPFARQPQIRFTYKPGSVHFIGLTAWQRDAFGDIEFRGVSGTKQQQQSGLPALHGHIQYHGERVMLGAGAYFRALRPIVTEDRFTTGAGQAYATVTTDAATIRAKATYGASLTGHLMTGGYVYNESENVFYPLNLLSTWIDVDGTGTLAPGVFAGYFTNKGSSDEVGNLAAITPAARGADIDYAWRVSPRLSLNYDALRFAFELEITSARYASAFDEDYAPAPADGDDPVTNVRSNFSVFLSF